MYWPAAQVAATIAITPTSITQNQSGVCTRAEPVAVTVFGLDSGIFSVLVSSLPIS